MQKLKDPRVLTICAMLAALATVFGLFKVPVNQFVEFRFAFLPISAAGAMFGPGVGAIIGAMGDVLGYLVKPTGPFFPGFTISSAISGLIYGLLLYKKPLTVPRVIITQFIQTIVYSLLLNTLNLTILYNTPFMASLITRLPQNAVMFPINTVLLYLILKGIQQVSKQFMPMEVEHKQVEAKN